MPSRIKNEKVFLLLKKISETWFLCFKNGKLTPKD